MDTKKLIAEIDSEIEKLIQARSALLAIYSNPLSSTGKKRGRPKGSGVTRVAVTTKPKKRTLSALGRKRISDAMKKRWSTRKAIKSAPSASKVGKATPAKAKTTITSKAKAENKVENAASTVR